MKNRTRLQIRNKLIIVGLGLSLALAQPLALLANEEAAESVSVETPEVENTDASEQAESAESSESATSSGSEEPAENEESSSSSASSGEADPAEEPDPTATPEPTETPEAGEADGAEEAADPEAKKEHLFQLTVLGDGGVKILYSDAAGAVVEAHVAGDKQNVQLQILPGVHVTLIPEPGEGQGLAEWVVDLGEIAVVENAFEMPATEVAVTASFKSAEEIARLSADGASQEAQDENKDRPAKTNEQLIAEQNIQPLPVAPRDFRFWTVEKNVAFVKEDMVIRENIQDEARPVAVLKKNDAVYLLEEVDQNWYYVESGEARGFIKKDSLLEDKEKKELLVNYIRRAQKESTAQKQGQAIARFFSYAEVTVPRLENDAYLYRKCTTEKVVMDKHYAIAVADQVNILEDTDSEARVCGTLGRGALAYVIADETEDWVYVESGDVRGFVRREQVRIGDKVDEEVQAAGGDERFARCAEKVAAAENRATYYTLTSIKEGTPVNPIRDAILKSAEQCLGHPYVWGGTSLLNGCDCSGFVQSLYALYGYGIPRVAENQAMFGRQIPVECAEPGDLIFFAKDGYVYHVAMYAGNDQTIEAYGAAQGIIRNGVDHVNAVWATKVITD